MLSIENEIILHEWDVAIHTLNEIKKGKIEVTRFRLGSIEDDEIVVEANSLILDTLANADSVAAILKETNKNLRDQLSLQEAIEMHKERELRGFGIRRN